MSVKMVSVAIAVATVVGLGSVSAQQAISVNFGQQVTSGAPQAESDTVKVQGRGVGVNKDAALKDAYRDAIERAVGLYVDAETVAKNDEVVTDQILTQSNAYITNFSELGTKQIDGGLVQVRILATVKKQALTTKLTGVMPPQTVRIDNTDLQNVHAQLVTKEKRAEDAAALLKNALDGLNPMKSLMVANIRPETQKILTGEAVKINDEPLPANQVMLRYLFEVKLDRAKYFSEFVPHLKKVLDQISVTKPKEIRLTELLVPGSDRRREFLQNFVGITNLGENIPDDPRDSGSDMVGSCSPYCNFNGAYFDPIHCYSILWQGENWLWKFGNYDCGYRPKSGGAFSWKAMKLTNGDFNKDYRKDKVYFALITSLNANCSNGKVTLYELDKSVIEMLNEWRKGLIDKKDGRYLEQNTTNYNIVLLDKDGEEIGVYPWQIPNGMLMNVKFAEIPNAGMVYATPFVGCFGENLIQWRDFVLEKDQLTKVASIKIEVAD